MKKINQLLFITFCVLTQGASAQGFVNLDFEDATIVLDTSSPYYPYAVYASDALPGWTVTSGLLYPNDILYNNLSLGSPSVSLFGLNSQYSPPPLDGAFSVGLYGGSPGATSGASISQMGLVPSNAASIRFIAQSDVPPTGSLLVSLGGQNVPLSVVGTGPNYTMYAGNISTFAGQVQQLIFAASPGNGSYWEIDDIQFSPSSVPEPSILGLFVLGSLFFGLRYRHNSA